jgi:hypothetical protein
LREVPDLKTHLPKNTGDELMAKIEKHQHDVPPYIANFTLSIDMERPARKALPSGRDDDQEEEKASGKDSMAALREKMAKRKAAKADE